MGKYNYKSIDLDVFLRFLETLEPPQKLGQTNQGTIYIEEVWQKRLAELRESSPEYDVLEKHKDENYSRACLKQAIYLFTQQLTKIQNEVIETGESNLDFETKAITENESKTQMTILSHSFVVHIYHYAEKYIKLLSHRNNIFINDSYVLEDIIKQLNKNIYRKYFTTFMQLRLLANNIKHDYLISKNVRDNCAGLFDFETFEKARYLPDLTDYLFEKRPFESVNLALHELDEAMR